MRRALAGKARFIITPESSEHRVFVFVPGMIRAQGSLFCIANEDDAMLGILSSRIHEIWLTAQGNRLGAGNQRRYNVEVTFETFPFPHGLGPNIPAASNAADLRAQRIAAAARELDMLRINWLNPADRVRCVPEIMSGFPDRLLPVDDGGTAVLKQRTMTNLYNERPAWLVGAHRELDEAMAAAYGWPSDLSDDDVLSRLLTLNLERGGLDQPKGDNDGRIGLCSMAISN